MCTIRKPKPFRTVRGSCDDAPDTYSFSTLSQLCLANQCEKQAEEKIPASGVYGSFAIDTEEKTRPRGPNLAALAPAASFDSAAERVV